MSSETRNAFLYGQLQEGLRYNLMEAPAVSGAPDYQALCLAVKTEEKCRQYTRGLRLSQSMSSDSPPQHSEVKKTDGESKTTQSRGVSGGSGGPGVKQKATGRCWTCDKPGHKASECSSKPGKPRSGGNSQPPRTHQVQTSEDKDEQPGAGTTNTTQDTTQSTDPLQYLLPDSDEEGAVRVTEVRMKDKGSRPQLVRVDVGGVPLDGVVDTGRTLRSWEPKHSRR